MRKLLGKQVHDHFGDVHTSATSPLTLQPSSHRACISREFVHGAGSPIAVFDKSPDGSSAVLAGHHILKTVVVDGLMVRDGIDLRALISAQSAAKTGASSSIADQLSIRDVKWGETEQGNQTVFTACPNGKIFRYDVTRLGSQGAGSIGKIEYVQMREDSRQINELDINPHRGTLLLSGSQDGVVRLFDIREPVTGNSGLTFRCRNAFRCNAGGIRHVRWSPKEGLMFACGTDQGLVMRWDLRAREAPALRINAHMNEKMCSCIAWHPDGKHVMSAGQDGKCHVWDMYSEDKRQKAKYTISAPAPVASLVWRPGVLSVSASGKRAAQVAISYDETTQRSFGTPAVHIFDLSRPTLPFKELQHFEKSPSAMLWLDQDLLWTAGRDGLFMQCDLHFAPRVMDRQTVSTMAFSSRGDVAMLVDERAPPPRPRPQSRLTEGRGAVSYSSAPTMPVVSGDCSDPEDEIVDDFLCGGRKRHWNRRGSVRSARANALTHSNPPPSGTTPETFALDEGIRLTGVYRSQQAMAIGKVPAAAAPEVYRFLSRTYLETLYSELPPLPNSKPLPERIAIIIESCTRAAQMVGKFRLAQSWRLLGFGVQLLLEQRAQYHFKCRMERHSDPRRDWLPGRAHKNVGTPAASNVTVETRCANERSADSLDRTGRRCILSEGLKSTSGVDTPLAGPVQDNSDVSGTQVRVPQHAAGKRLSQGLEPESFTLPPTARPLSPDKRRRLKSAPVPINSDHSQAAQASTEGHSLCDTEAISNVVDELKLLQVVDEPKSRQTSRVRGAQSYSTRSMPLRVDSDDTTSGRIACFPEASRANSGLLASSLGSGPTRRQNWLETLVEQAHTSREDLSGGKCASRRPGKQLEEVPLARGSIALSPLPSLDRMDTDRTAFTTEHQDTMQSTDSGRSRDGVYPSQLETDALLSLGLQKSRLKRVLDNLDDSPHTSEIDYLFWPQDPSYPYPVDASSQPQPRQPAINPYDMISRSVYFEAMSSALNASAMILLFQPLLPPDLVDPFLATAVLRQHHARLCNMKLFVEAALLRKLCMKGWPGGVLTAWGDDYPGVFGAAQQGVQVGFWCSRCGRPREVDRSDARGETVWRCERCRGVMGPCAICGHRDSMLNVVPGNVWEEEAVLTTWWYCYGCGHGGHATCMQGWHSTAEPFAEDDEPPLELSDGFCPLDGCGHACLPGWGRTETLAQPSDKVSRVLREAARAARMPGGLGLIPASTSSFSSSGSGDQASKNAPEVRGDGNETGQGRAFESVRETLGSSGGLAGRGPLSSSPGKSSFFGERGGDHRDRRKSVKFVGADGKGV